MISHELSAVEANSRTSAMLAAQVEQFLAAGGQIDTARPLEIKPLPARRETEKAPRASRRAPKAAKPVKEVPLTLAERQRAKRAALAPQVRELAKTINARQIALRLNIGLTTLRTIGREYNIIFIPAKSASQIAADNRDRVFADRIRAFLGIGLTKRQACMRSGIGYRAFNRVCKAFNLHFPDAEED